MSEEHASKEDSGPARESSARKARRGARRSRRRARRSRQFVTESVYGDLYAREGIDDKTRETVILSVLCAQGRDRSSATTPRRRSASA